MATMLHSEMDWTIFRSEDGFSILQKFHQKHISLLKESEKWKVKDELQTSLVCALINLLSKLCSNSLLNIQEMAQKYTEAFSFLEEVLISAVDAIQLSGLGLMLQFSKADKIVQREFTRMFTWPRIVHSICSNVHTGSKRLLALRLKIILLLVPNREFVDAFQDSDIFSGQIAQLLPNNDEAIISTVLKILEHLYQREHLRKVFSQNWKLFENLIKLYSDKCTDEIVICALGIIFNTLHANSDLVQNYYSELFNSACNLSEVTCVSKTTIHERNFRVLRQIVQSSRLRCEQMWRPEVLKNIVHFLQQYNNCSASSEDLQMLCRYATNLLAVLAKNVKQFNRVQYMEKFDVNGVALMNFIRFSSKTHDFHCCANAALVLSFLIESTEGRLRFVKQHDDVCRELLSIASNHPNDSVRGNVAIVLSKLVSDDDEQLAQLRKLDGLKILHDCVKFVN